MIKYNRLYYPFEFLKTCLLVEPKIIILLNMDFNVCGGYI